MQINEQNANYQYYNNKKKNNINNIYKKTNYYNNNENISQDPTDYSNPLLSQSMNINLSHPRKFQNNKYYNTLNNNINLSNDYCDKNLTQDYGVSGADLSDTSFKHQTYQNYYNNNFPPLNNNDTSTSNFNDSYELNKTDYTKRLRNKFSDLSKLLSVSSRDNSSFEINKDDESYYSAAFRHPKKNDEDHYHQNLTIKIKKKNEKNKKDDNSIISARIPQKPIKYVDNTPKGCNISVNTDINNVKKKKINNFEIKPNEKKLDNYNLSLNSDLNYSNNSENFNN
jgi:hypothetical protein